MTHDLQPTAIVRIPPIFGEEGSNDVAPLQQESSKDAYRYDSAFSPNSINEEGAEGEGGTSHNGHLISIPISLYKEDLQTVPFLRMLQSIPVPFAQPQPPQPHCSFQMLLSLQREGMQSLVDSVDPGKLLEPQSCVTTASSCARSSPKKREALKDRPHHHHQQRNRNKRKQAARPLYEVESQRLSHIAVERNRRRLMNHYLQCLRSLMPSSYTQKDDQASIIGAAIDYVKTLEQLLQSLQAQKRMMMRTQHCRQLSNPILIREDDSEFVLEMKDTLYISSGEEEGDANDDEEPCGQVEVKVVKLIDKHVNLKIEFRGRKKKSIMRHEGQLVRAIAGLEEQLSLTVLHLNISSSQSSSSSTVHYSLSLRIEEDCKLEGADGIAASVADLFRSDSDSDAMDAIGAMQ